MFIIGRQQKSASIKISNNNFVADNEILHVYITEHEDALSSVYHNNYQVYVKNVIK